MNRIVNAESKAALCVLLISLLGVLTCGCSSESDQKKSADFSGVHSVCELSTLDAYYHNVAKADVPASGPLADLLKTGHKRVWIEYSGIVRLGIDADQVTIGEPNEQGEVEVHIPDVRILEADLDSDSISDPIVETGFLTWVTPEEKTAGIAAAQEDMREKAGRDQMLNTQAYDKARRTIAGYVQNVGEAIGESYTVKWV